MTSNVSYDRLNSTNVTFQDISDINMTKDEGRKKRSRNPDNWIKTKRKQAIIAGQSYVNTKGDVVSSKLIGPNCNCKNKCFVGVDKNSREMIFRGFYNLKSYDEQNSYLYGLIRRHEIQRKRQPNTERRTCTYKYYVRVQGNEVMVCKKAFASIHGISDKKIRTLCLKHEKNVMFPRDNRGRHSNRPKKVLPSITTAVKRHLVDVLSSPVAFDYIKADKAQPSDINVSKLYKNFLQLHDPHAIDSTTDRIKKGHDCAVKAWVYFKVLHEEFKSLDYNVVKRKLPHIRKGLADAAASGINLSADDGGGSCQTKGININIKHNTDAKQARATTMSSSKHNPGGPIQEQHYFVTSSNFSNNNSASNIANVCDYSLLKSASVNDPQSPASNQLIVSPENFNGYCSQSTSHINVSDPVIVTSSCSSGGICSTYNTQPCVYQVDGVNNTTSAVTGSYNSSIHEYSIANLSNAAASIQTHHDPKPLNLQLIPCASNSSQIINTSMASNILIQPQIIRTQLHEDVQTMSKMTSFPIILNSGQAYGKILLNNIRTSPEIMNQGVQSTAKVATVSVLPNLSRSNNSPVNITTNTGQNIYFLVPN